MQDAQSSASRPVRRPPQEPGSPAPLRAFPPRGNGREGRPRQSRESSGPAMEADRDERLRREAAEYYRDHRVPQRMEEALNTLFPLRPADLYGDLVPRSGARRAGAPREGRWGGAERRCLRRAGRSGGLGGVCGNVTVFAVCECAAIACGKWSWRCSGFTGCSAPVASWFLVSHKLCRKDETAKKVCNKPHVAT